MMVPANAATAARDTNMLSDDVSTQPTIYLPQLNHLCKVLTRGNDQGLHDETDSRQKVRIPTQRVLTALWMRNCARFASPNFPNIPARMKEQLQLHRPQKIPLSDPNSVLRSEMSALDSDDDPLTERRTLVMDFTVTHERHGGSRKDPNGTLCVKNIKNRDRE